MMSPPVRKQIGDFVESSYYKFLITIIRSEDFGSDFYSIELISQKALDCGKQMKKVDFGNRFWWFWICTNDDCDMFKTKKDALSEFKKPDDKE